MEEEPQLENVRQYCVPPPSKKMSKKEAEGPPGLNFSSHASEFETFFHLKGFPPVCLFPPEMYGAEATEATFHHLHFKAIPFPPSSVGTEVLWSGGTKEVLT